MSDHNFDQLRAYILSCSRSQDWTNARLEWQLDGVDELERAEETCPCGYHPIKFLCWLYNTITHARVFVGNVCVNRFLPEHNVIGISEGLKRIRESPGKAANKALLVWAHKIGLITDWEYVFGLDTCRKRNLSWRQEEKRIQINRRIHARLTARQAVTR